MLRITADVFSGRPNPEWFVEDESEARATLRALSMERQLLQEAPPPEAKLGFRGLLVEVTSDELARDAGLSASLYVAADTAARDGRAAELVDRLIALAGAGRPTPAAEGALPLDAPLQSFLREQLARGDRLTSEDRLEPLAAPQAEAEAARIVCTYDLSPYNPGFWNNDANIRARNNCYNYASNKRTDTFAQPGRGAGHMYTAITCPEVTRGALADGLHRRFDCFPEAERPRYLVALVVAPGPGFVDFHWYRKMKEGFWGHKPGGTAVRNVDNGNRVIMDPAACDRGPYTQFCGYFYTCLHQKIR